MEEDVNSTPTGPDVAGLALERLVGVPAVVVRVLGLDAVGAEALPPAERLAGHAVLVHTGHARHWGSERYLGPAAPHLTAAAVDALVAAGPGPGRHRLAQHRRRRRAASRQELVRPDGSQRPVPPISRPTTPMMIIASEAIRIAVSVSPKATAPMAAMTAVPMPDQTA